MTAITTVPGFEVYDDRFAAVLRDEPRLVRLAETDAHEGPVYVAAEDALYFTSLPRVGADGARVLAIRRVELNGTAFDATRVTTVQADANVANGMAAHPGGGLIVCEQGTRTQPARITRFDPATGSVDTVVDAWEGLPLNSPNDVVVRSDGTIWFTDPSYGYLQGFRPQPRVGNHVYRYDPSSGRLSVVADDFDKPNGLAFSPDETVLYITDSGANQEPDSYHANRPHHVIAYDVRNGRHLTGRRLFAVTAQGFPDGIKVDTAGRVYVSSSTGLHVYATDGDLIGRINVPGAVNFAFGGPDRDVLFITADTAIWAAVLNAQGGKP
jgi:gluconolactonase